MGGDEDVKARSRWVATRGRRGGEGGWASERSSREREGLGGFFRQVSGT